ncbi:Hypothetical protein PHPALM_3738 [Phytophthora palmivora]|uniref:Uncharacterized protein n=1 Tax=Phytophthora palmivora TaxID=4796 RepID=A0A2P4YLN8_9STRA|nr:Hypothetical protein PHPALM_3738 [Phytophthora palmivora]
MEALDTLTKRLGSKASEQVCIGYGDWSRRDGIKGYGTGPKEKEIAEMLKFRNPKLASKKVVLKCTRNAQYKQSMQGELLEPRRQCREEYAGSAPERTEGKAWHEEIASIQMRTTTQLKQP